MRGGKSAAYETCPHCGSAVLMPRPTPRYVLRRELGREGIYQDWQGSMYFSPGVLEEFNQAQQASSHRITRQEWQDVWFELVSVRDEPADGAVLPGDPGYAGA